MRINCLILMLLSGSNLAAEPVDWEAKRAALGREDKYRILVDKVWSRSNGWVLTDEHLEEIRLAGYNVIVPRIGGDDRERVRRVSRMAQDRGLFYMAWMRGTKSATEGHRLVWEDGLEQNLYSPNADELWEELENAILDHARIAAETPSFIGTFLDFENYEPDAPDVDRWNCYPLSFDGKILKEFAESAGFEIPDLSPEGRAEWLKEKDLYDAFRDFQFESWRNRCRLLREKIDAINPQFQLIVYPPMKTDFIEEAIYPEWGTREAPLVLAEYFTYGRKGWIGHEEALRQNLQRMTERMGFVRERGVFHQYIGGIDPLVTGADPEFCGKNAVMLAEVSEGYWNFYEGPTYGRSDHDRYLSWLSRANVAIATKEYGMAWEERVEPDLLSTAVLFDPDHEHLKVGQLGIDYSIHHQLNHTGGHHAYSLKGPAFEFLKQFDVILLHDYRLPSDDPWAKDLRRYAEAGGNLILFHNMAAEMDYLFPEIGKCVNPRSATGAIEYVLSVPFVPSQSPSLPAFIACAEIRPSHPEHTFFEPGEQGTVWMKDPMDRPVLVHGKIGEGHVAFFGAYYGKDLEPNPADLEMEFLIGLIDWLVNR